MKSAALSKFCHIPKNTVTVLRATSPNKNDNQAPRLNTNTWKSVFLQKAKTMSYDYIWLKFVAEKCAVGISEL